LTATTPMAAAATNRTVTADLLSRTEPPFRQDAYRIWIGSIRRSLAVRFIGELRLDTVGCDF
jgi:hypothetical protein